MKKEYCPGISNYRQYVNTWWWGKTITLVSTDGYSTVELQFDNSLPNIAVIKGLMVFTTRQRKGYGTEMMNLCEYIAKKEEMKFLQLSVNKEHVLLVNWYERLGFTIIQIDEHEYTMLKALDNYQKQWKPTEEQMKALKNCCDGWSDNGDGILDSLYEQLKKLKV